jgi:hypothetical protein
MRSRKKKSGARKVREKKRKSAKFGNLPRLIRVLTTLGRFLTGVFVSSPRDNSLR